MGEVWRGVHRTQDVPVAVKVLTSLVGRDEGVLASFRHEVRAAASLDHSGIVTVFDYGQVGASTEEASRGAIEAGTPYLVMELIDGVSAAELKGQLPWAGLKHVLLGLLDALAHAHARGLVHRDLKPANLLLPGDPAAWRLGAPAVGIKLTDFGVALDLDAEGEDDEIVGTPNYMAPEQVQARWRDFGPWTDLYGCGCLAYTLAVGNPPFKLGNLHATLTAHCMTELPALAPDLAVPDGFEQWLHRMTAKSPRRRFRRAADAAWALLNLGDSEDGSVVGQGALERDDTIVERMTFDDRADQTDPTAVGEEALPETLHWMEGGAETTLPLSDVAASGTAGTDAPPHPRTWERPEPPVAGMRLTGAGLTLYGLRTVPLVDRTPERDALWQALLAVRVTGRARALVLTGPAGSGKSRLARWMCERGHEVGAADVLRAEHGPAPGPGHGLGPMLMRFMRAQGLDRKGLLERAESVLRRLDITEPHHWHALVEMISPAPADAEADTVPVCFVDPAERYARIRSLLARLASDRPVIVWLDDVQWGADALAFAEQLLVSQDRYALPVLLVMTVQSEAMADRPAERDVVSELLKRDDAAEVEVGSLPAAFRGRLIRELLGLEGALATRVEERTAGNPLFAVQLVGDWVHRGVLVPGSRGFRLQRGAVADLPDDLHQVWSSAIDRLLEDRPAADEVALQVRAVLGPGADAGEWKEACARLGVEPSPDLVEVLLQRRLARPREGGLAQGWAFVHTMLNESLERRARDSGQWAEHHRVCADMLRERAATKGQAERIGRHLVQAQALQEALAPLLEGARACVLRGDCAGARELLKLRETTLGQLGVDKQDARWGHGWAISSEVARRQGRFQESQWWYTKLERTSRERRWEDLLPVALVERGTVMRMRGDDMEAAFKTLSDAADLASTRGDEMTRAHGLRELGILCKARGDLAGAVDFARAAQASFEAAGSTVYAARCLLNQCHVAAQQGRLDDADALLAEAERHFQEAGCRWGLAHCGNQRGEHARFRGDLEEAERCYRDSLAMCEAVGLDTVTRELNLAVTLTEAGRYVEARALLEGTVRTVERQGRKPLIGCCSASLLPALAGVEDWRAWDKRVLIAVAELQATGFVNVDVARSAELAGRLAAQAGQGRRAKDAYEIAWTQLRTLGDAAGAQAARDAMEAL